MIDPNHKLSVTRQAKVLGDVPIDGVLPPQGTV
jgi:hypothetical protein